MKDKLRVVDHSEFFILFTTIVCMQMYISLWWSKVVEHTDNSIGLLSHVKWFIYEVVYLSCIASEHMPNIAHFLGMRKYMGSGWRGSFG